MQEVQRIISAATDSAACGGTEGDGGVIENSAVAHSEQHVTSLVFSNPQNDHHFIRVSNVELRVLLSLGKKKKRWISWEIQRPGELDYYRY